MWKNKYYVEIGKIGWKNVEKSTTVKVSLTLYVNKQTCLR